MQLRWRGPNSRCSSHILYLRRNQLFSSYSCHVLRFGRISISLLHNSAYSLDFDHPLSNLIKIARSFPFRLPSHFEQSSLLLCNHYSSFLTKLLPYSIVLMARSNLPFALFFLACNIECLLLGGQTSHYCHGNLSACRNCGKSLWKLFPFVVGPSSVSPLVLALIHILHVVAQKQECV